MKNKQFILSFIFTLFISQLSGQDKPLEKSKGIDFKGQFSSVAHFNGSNELPLWLGVRYIPQLNYSFDLPNLDKPEPNREI